MRRLGLPLLFCWALAMGMLALPLPAAAEVVVLGSDVDGISVGATLDDAATLVVPANQRVRLLLPSGRTQLVTGPFRGVVKDLSKNESRDDGLLSQVRQWTTPEPRAAAPAPTTRSVRSATKSAPPPRATFSWREVPVDAEGDYCVERGAPLALVKATGVAADRVTVVDVQDGKRVETVFGSGSTTAPWPAAVPPKVGTFALIMPERPPRQVRLRLIAPLPEKDQMLRVLHGQRCHRQMQSLVRAMQDTSY